MSGPLPTLRPAVEDDVPAICELLAAEFDDNPKANPAVYRWQYFDNPFGAQGSWVAEAADGRIVGHAGLFATPGVIDGQACVIGHDCDAVVATEWRGRGIYVALTGAHYEAAPDVGHQAVISITNAASTPGAVKAGLVLRHRTRAWIGGPWLVGRSRVGGSGGREVDEAPSSVTRLASNHDRGRNGIARTGEWLHWRYGGHPFGTYRLFVAGAPEDPDALVISTTVTRGSRRLVYVMELLWAEDSAGVAALRAAARGQAASEPLVLLAAPGAATGRLAARAGFLPLPRRLEPQPQHIGLTAGSRGVDGLWTVSWGDHDHL